MQYKQYAVPASLKTWIRYFWSFDSYAAESQPLHVRSFADYFPRLIFQDVQSFSSIKSAEGCVMPMCYLSGLDTKPSDAFWDNNFSHFGISFFPHALHSFFGINAAELTNQTPDIRLFDHSGISNILQEAGNHEKRVEAMCTYFYNKILDRNPDQVINDLFHHSFHQLVNNKNLTPLVRHYAVSERQLQRRFKVNVGVSVSKFNRIVRFEKSLKMLPAVSYGELTALAYELGYTDQAHFINDFKLFSGLSPYQFIKTEPLSSENASFIYAQ